MPSSLKQFTHQSKKEGKIQESLQSSTTPERRYQWESDNVTIVVTIIHHKRDTNNICIQKIAI